MKARVVVVVAAAACGSSQSAAPPASCIGDRDVRTFAVYLHGMDAASVSGQEHANRAALAEVARMRGMRIAVPRATTPCPEQPGTLCWGWTWTAEERAAAVATIEAAATACFGPQPYGLIGFSNGGYLLARLARTCELPSRARWAIAIGSEMFRGTIEPEPASLAACAPLVLLTGTGDAYNADPSHTLATQMRTRGARVETIAFDGGHVVPIAPLATVIERQR